MLCSLKIENVAVIEKAEVEFGPGLNVLTGETGAGKSILIDSIHAILGDRTSRDIVRSHTPKACIWATFRDLPASVRRQLEQAGMDAGDELLLYREITAEGQSRFRVNGLQAAAKVVRAICRDLIDIHGQHDSQGLTDPARHLGLLDLYAHAQPQHAAYYAVYRQLVQVKRDADKLRQAREDRERRAELLRYQLEEIEDAELEPGEEEDLVRRRNLAANAQNIANRLAEAYDALEGGEDQAGAADLAGEASNALQGAAGLSEDLAQLSERAEEIYYNLRELCADLADRLDAPAEDAGALDAIEERLDVIFRLKRKYGDSVESVLAYADHARQELENMENADQRLEQLEEEKQRLFHQAKQLADRLTEVRLAAFERFNTEISQALDFLNMPGIRFALHHTRGPLASAGQDTVEFYISTNPGEEPKPLARIASGGELSRIMLAIKSALADADNVGTVIYDEIDTGVSGKAAGRIGRKLLQTARGRQVLCITHTAQIAALADQHLLIQKNLEGGRAYTEIHPLDEAARQRELARIISGDEVSPAALAAAREMRAAKENMA